MSRKFLSHTLLASAVFFSLSGAAFAQSTTEDEAKKAGHATKDRRRRIDRAGARG